MPDNILNRDYTYFDIPEMTNAKYYWLSYQNEIVWACLCHSSPQLNHRAMQLGVAWNWQVGAICMIKVSVSHQMAVRRTTNLSEQIHH